MKYCFQLQSQESGCISLSGNLHLSYGFLTSPLSAVRRKCKVRTLLKKAANPQRRKYHEKFIQVSDWEQQYYNHRWHHHSFEQNKIISPGVDMLDKTDGTGVLVSPKGKSAIYYVIIPGVDDILYRYHRNEEWRSYKGSKENFKKNMEKSIKSN